MAEKKEFGKPRIRLPRRIKQDSIIRAAVRVSHNSYTGLGFVDGKYFSDRPAYYLKRMEVYYGGELACSYDMTSATSPNPLIRFRLKADKEAQIRVVMINSDGVRKEGSRMLKFG